jgi:Fe-S cluster biogenesis protein NfuA
MFIETETTPNPATLKFLPGQAVMTSGTRDFVSVTAAPGADWSALKPQVVAVLLDHFVSQAPLFSGASASFSVPAEEAAFEEDPADAEIIDQIKELIETRVRPAVAGDGGDIHYRGYRDGVVYLTMHGACSGCPSSSATLKHGIEGLLKHYVPEVHEVRAA